MNHREPPSVINFTRTAKYKFVKALGSGACGETVLVHDENMECNFVVKKYSPIYDKHLHEEEYTEFLERFRQEAKILFQLNHPNVVRVYNFFDYKEQKTSYILMEYVDGEDIFEYSRSNPSLLDTIFERVVDGFVHLEGRGILHRDIRPANILVDRANNAKIIDFGFGKVVGATSTDAEKSISLNWWCEVPPEFAEAKYDLQTEVYFVGRLFEKIIVDEGLSSFKYVKLVNAMCCKDRSKRVASFSAIQNAIRKGQFEELNFSQHEIETYRAFSNEICHVISSFSDPTIYNRDQEKVINLLESVYKKSMLEEEVYRTEDIVSSFFSSPFRFYNSRSFDTVILRNFIQLMKSLDADKRSIVLENILARFDSLDKTPIKKYVLNDDIPF